MASVSIIYLKIYEQLFNKFINVLFIKTPNKNIFVYLSLSLSMERKEEIEMEWSRAWNEAQIKIWRGKILIPSMSMCELKLMTIKQ